MSEDLNLYSVNRMLFYYLIINYEQGWNDFLIVYEDSWSLSSVNTLFPQSFHSLFD